mgnify:CR=1 FL=1
MNNTFEDVISDLVIEAHVRVGQPVRIWLRGSLAVEVSIRRDWTKLTLFRDGYAPSEDELRRVIDAWPGRIRMTCIRNADAVRCGDAEDLPAR